MRNFILVIIFILCGCSIDEYYGMIPHEQHTSYDTISYESYDSVFEYTYRPNTNTTFPDHILTNECVDIIIKGERVDIDENNRLIIYPNGLLDISTYNTNVSFIALSKEKVFNKTIMVSKTYNNMILWASDIVVIDSFRVFYTIK